MPILPAEFQLGCFLEFLVTLGSLLRREKEEIEIVALAQNLIRDMTMGTSLLKGFSSKFLCNCAWVYVNSFTQIYNLLHVKMSQNIPFSTL